MVGSLIVALIKACSIHPDRGTKQLFSVVLLFKAVLDH
jgi:hypothetical protein